MAEIEFKLPEAQSSSKTLNALDKEVVRTRNELKSKKEAIEEFLVLQQQNNELEAKIEEAKRTMFLLLYDRLRRGEQDHADEYCAYLEKELDALGEGKDAGAEGKKK